MTALQVHTCCEYLTAGGNWRSADYDARAIVKSVKGEDFNGYFDAVIDGKPIKLSSANKDVDLDVSGRVLASRLKELAGGMVTLVPVPNSSACVGSVEQFRTEKLARAVAAYYGALAEVETVLLWKKPKEKQHQVGGYRSAMHFIDKMAIIKTPVSPVVLIDDVVTSGSQMLASTYLLRQRGVEVLFGMAVGRTTQVQTENTLAWDERKVQQLIIKI